MFKPRTPRSLSYQFRQFAWPSMGWRRALKYVALRIMRLHDANNAVPRGIACGVTVSFIPIFGIHGILSALCAFILRGNILAALIGTMLLPPMVLPLVFSLDFIVGRKIMTWAGYSVDVSEAEYLHQTTQGVHSLWGDFNHFFIPALVGAAFFMPLVAPASFVAARRVVAWLKCSYKKRKDRKQPKQETLL